MVLLLKTVSNFFYVDVREVWWQLIYPLAGYLQDLDFGMFLGRGIGQVLYDSYFLSVIYLLS